VEGWNVVLSHLWFILHHACNALVGTGMLAVPTWKSKRFEDRHAWHHEGAFKRLPIPSAKGGGTTKSSRNR